ncbi:polysaccharide biosynthesis protein [Neobacillus sp. WH10]|uniref:putative polysaccharide biosynthesis protein n=1 Tax=Neobacillus sp. WH10 TaxID=3047873 RepID=UPI0024C16675|nr:polysaccharide biosynthesis protein [Neobacillus sp. WH10]WHY76514.1 polysaccharide biosynthesis protein [Neobacillus sp. WH10]
MQSKLLRGTFILTFGTIFSKVIGLIYVIPFFQIVGREGTTLYQYSYVPYTIFISIATAGVPLAVSKFISKYNALEEYAVGRKLFKSGLVIMLLTGIMAFLVMYLAAPTLAEMSVGDEKANLDNVTTVMRAVSFALIVVPFMSLIRGFFQGHQSMGPSALSQVVEQIVRIAFTLLGAFAVLHIFHGTMVTAVSVATFAAFIGAIGGLIVLFWYWYKRKPYLDELLTHDKGTIDISLKEIYKEIIIYAFPFVLVGIANPLFQAIDQFTFKQAMEAIGKKEFAESFFSILNFESHKIVIIPVSLATAFSLTLVPSITKAFVEGERASLNHQLNQTFQVLLFLTLPASIGLSLLAEPVYTVFYQHDLIGTEVLRAYAPVAILFSLYSVTAAILQGINEQRFTVLSLLVGLLIKLSLNIPLIKLMETRGAVLATALGYTAAILINLIVIKAYARYPFRLVWRRSLLIIIFAGLMWVGTEIMYKILLLFLSPASKIQSVLIILICALVGAGIYFYFGLKSGLTTRLFGDKIDRLLTKLKLPKRGGSIEN